MLQARGGFKAACSESGDASLPILVFYESLRDLGVTMGLPPHTLLGFKPQQELRSLHLSSLRGDLKPKTQREQTPTVCPLPSPTTARNQLGNARASEIDVIVLSTNADVRQLTKMRARFAQNRWKRFIYINICIQHKTGLLYFRVAQDHVENLEVAHTGFAVLFLLTTAV